MASSRYWLGVSQRQFARRALVRRAACGTAGLIGASLAGCASKSKQTAQQPSVSSPKSAATEPKSGGTLNVVANYNAKNLDPHLTSGGTERPLQSAAMSRPLRFKSGADPKVAADHDVEGDLALSAESPDAVTWTLRLRPDAKFQNLPPVNGHAVEAEDIKATYTRFLTIPRNPNHGALTMVDPAQIEAPDSHTVVFKLKYPYAPFPMILASPVYSWILPREGAAGGYDLTNTLIGSGPFILESATPDVAYVFRKNPDWFEKGRPYVDHLRFAVIPAMAQRIAQFSAGNLDELTSIGINDRAAVKQANTSAATVTIPANNPNPIYMQLGDPTSPFQDIRLRRALSMALDRATLGKTAFGGEYDTFVFVPPTLGKWSLSVKDLDASTAQYYKYNPSRAKQMLQAAGAADLALRLAFIANGPFPGSYKTFYESVGSMLQGAGLKITLVDQDYHKDFIDAGKGSRQGYFPKDMLLFAGVAQYTSPDEYLFNYFDSRSTSNQEHLKDSGLDAMLTKARALVNSEAQLKAYLDIQRYIAENMFAVTTASGFSYTFLRPGVQNYNPSSSYAVGTETYAKLWLK